MRILNKTMKFLAVLLVVFIQFIFMSVPVAHAATSPSLGNASGFSVLGGAAVTSTGITTTNGAVGVSPGSSITDNGTLTAGGGLQANNASAIAAQASTVTLFGALDQTCTANYDSGQDLTLISPLVPGVYCSAGSFLLTGNLTLSGSGVWIFKTVSTLITSPGSSVTGGDACNVWWRIGSAATLDTTTSFIGTIVTANVGDTTAMKTGATLDGRILAQAAATVTLDANTITGTCTAAAAAASSSTTVGAPAAPYCATLNEQIVAPNIIQSRRVSPTSMFVSWGPYSGVNTFNVEYGTVNGNWLYNVDVTGFSTTINNLPANQPIWVRVAARSICTIGTYGPSKLVGGPMLPNTGFAPRENKTPWFIPAGVLITISTLLVLIQRKQIFSSRH